MLEIELDLETKPIKRYCYDCENVFLGEYCLEFQDKLTGVPFFLCTVCLEEKQKNEVQKI